MRSRLDRLEARVGSRRPADLGAALTDEEATAAYSRLVPRPEVPLADQLEDLDPAVAALAGRMNAQLAGLDAQALSERYRQVLGFGRIET